MMGISMVLHTQLRVLK